MWIEHTRHECHNIQYYFTSLCWIFFLRYICFEKIIISVKLIAVSGITINQIIKHVIIVCKQKKKKKKCCNMTD